MARTSVFFLLSLCMLLSLVGTSSAGARKTANIYELRKGDFSVKVTNWGGVILSVVLPDSNGKLGDIVLAYEGIGPYLNDTTYFGALVGRVGNRIAGSRFVLNGKPYRLFPNNGNNSLHGGHRGFSDVFWTVKKKVDGETPYITLYYHSFDGEQGFPGDLDVYVTYKLSENYALSISMEAHPRNKATPVNLIQHTYWNLGGEGSGTILKDKVQIFASQITPVDEDLIPTGTFKSVKGTPYDFLEPKEVGSEIESVKGGYDINYVLDSPADSKGLLRKVAVVESESSGRKMELWADKPGVQFYTAGFLEDVKGKNGHVYPQYGGLCLETQGFPDAVNQPKFPSVIVKPGQVYNHNMVFKFSF
ncbi:aldose 1-epimerase [Iris pallida]|uniref:Aldose 1-epimerase n=1 Tax=Iris pallida TaxID=29817 RepID=A0AAX6GYV9_IRIPA|nr:aldose 1-epimerase [Iris pallida]